MPTLLVVDDDSGFRDGLTETLCDLGHRALGAGSAAEAFALLDREPIDGVFLDFRMPRQDGIAALRRLRERPDGAALPVVVLTAFASAANTIEAMRLGAVDHLTKPVGRAEIAALLDRLFPGGVALATPAAADEALPLVGDSPAMRTVQKLIGLAASGDATVLITGETGTGKELVARAIHQYSARASAPFVAVNCAAIPRDLLESELFGHARGAFTGAVAPRAGRFREAEGGTLLLDEIGDMDPAMQAKILRALQERVIEPVGGAPQPVDLRIVAATHRALDRAIAEGAFRADLYYRLAVLPIRLPPLRDRPEDILPLAAHFLAQASPRGLRLSQAAERRLLAHPWPGNVRELRNAMERVAALVRTATVGAEDLGFLGDGAAPAAAPDGDLPGAVARLESEMIRRALAAAAGNRAEAARRLGIHRQLLYEKLRRYGIG
jgi:two-component system NtrC family response regulator